MTGEDEEVGIERLGCELRTFAGLVGKIVIKIVYEKTDIQTALHSGVPLKQ